MELDTVRRQVEDSFGRVDVLLNRIEDGTWVLPVFGRNMKYEIHLRLVEEAGLMLYAVARLPLKVRHERLSAVSQAIVLGNPMFLFGLLALSLDLKSLLVHVKVPIDGGPVPSTLGTQVMREFETADVLFRALSVIAEQNADPRGVYADLQAYV